MSPVASRLANVDSPGALLVVFQDLIHTGIRDTPRAVAGLLLFIMAFGLLTRSRLAWSVSVLLTAASLVVFILDTGQTARWFLGTFNVVLLLALMLSYRHFQRTSFAAASLFAITSVATVLVFAAVGTYVLGAQFTPKITDFTTAIYFSIVTISTVGYGDIRPDTPTAMLFVISVIVLGITVFATSVSTLLVPLLNRKFETLLHPMKGREMDRSNHYVIISRSTLAQNCYRELSGRNQKVTFIMRKSTGDDPDDVDVVIGDPQNVDVLEKAGVANANAVLVLGDDDSDNAFVVLAVKEVAGSVKTGVVANDAANLPRLRRVHPDFIIAPQILGGELLAMALTGEKIDSENLVSSYLQIN